MKITTRVFGKPTYGDLKVDGCDDTALYLVQDPGGSEPTGAICCGEITCRKI